MTAAVKELEPAAPTLLHLLARQRHWQTHSAFQARFEHAAAELADAEGDPMLRAVTVSRRQFQRWMAGELKRRPHPEQCRVLERMFNTSVDALLAPTDEQPSGSDASASRSGGARPGPVLDPHRGISELVSDAAMRSAEFGGWADSLALGDLAVTSLRLRVEQLAHAYVHQPMLPVFQQLMALRDELVALLKSPDPAQAQPLYFLTGVTCGLLAHASGNLGDVRAAQLQAHTALVCARHAQNPTLAAWIMGVRALQSGWSGALEQALECLAEADRWLTKAPPGSVHAWIRAIEARAFARLGRDTDAVLAAKASLHRREEVLAATEDDLDQIGGILSFPVAKQHYYVASAHRRIGRFDLAAEHAQTAIDAYADGAPEDRSYGDEVLARLDLAIAHTAGQPQLDAALACLAPVLDLPEDMRLATFVGSLRELNSVLEMPAIRSAHDARELRAGIADLLASCQRPLNAIEKSSAG